MITKAYDKHRPVTVQDPKCGYPYTITLNEHKDNLKHRRYVKGTKIIIDGKEETI
jgi:hypothetical protein